MSVGFHLHIVVDKARSIVVVGRWIGNKQLSARLKYSAYFSESGANIWKMMQRVSSYDYVKSACLEWKALAVVRYKNYVG